MSVMIIGSKYKLMETNMDRIKQNMKDKVPEIERSLDIVRHLQDRQVRARRAAIGAATVSRWLMIYSCACNILSRIPLYATRSHP